MSRLGALVVASVLALIHGLAAPRQTPDQFVPGCPLPFVGLEDHHSIDTTCPNEGQPKPTTGHVAENEAQDRTKNNFCATGTPASVTWVTFKALQTATDALPPPFTYGSATTLPTDRSPIRAPAFYTTSNGDAVHEGTLVRTVAYLLHGAYSDTGTGESVNCYLPGVDTNDIHLALVKSKPTATTDECTSFTAEITPHFRPGIWLSLAALHKTSTRTANQRIADANLDRPLRITGQIMFDGSHRPCVGGAGSPKRISLWEIHPVYAIDVCKTKTLTTCREGLDADWQSFDAWIATQG
jgi:hypothetical protein